MAVKQNVWDWTGFTGLADNSYISQKGHYANGSFNIDNQTEPGGAKLTPISTEYHSTTGEPTSILNLTDYGSSGIFVFDDIGNVYRNGVLVYTLASGDAILGSVSAFYDEGSALFEPVLFLYFFTKKAVHKMDTTNYSVTVDHETFEEDNRDKYPVNVYGEVYFASKYNFYKLNKLGVLSTIYRFPAEEEVRGITFFQDNFNIYTSTGGQGRQYIFPILSETPYYNIEWNGLPILGVANLGSTDYVVTGYSYNYSDLYIVSGTQRQIIKANTEASQGRGFHGPIYSRLDDIYIGGEFQGNDTVYKYGNYFPGFKAELIPFNSVPLGEITCFGSSQSALYFGTSSNKVYEVNLATNAGTFGYQTSGELVSMSMDFGTPESKKSLQELHVVYDNNSTYSSERGGTITIYARQGLKHTWKLLKTTGFKSDTGVVKVYAAELASLEIPLGDFYQIQLKAVLEGGSTTPFLKKVRVIYQDNLQA